MGKMSPKGEGSGVRGEGVGEEGFGSGGQE
jgi:hypothetical protein